MDYCGTTVLLSCDHQLVIMVSISRSPHPLVVRSGACRRGVPIDARHVDPCFKLPSSQGIKTPRYRERLAIAGAAKSINAASLYPIGAKTTNRGKPRTARDSSRTVFKPSFVLPILRTSLWLLLLLWFVQFLFDCHHILFAGRYYSTVSFDRDNIVSPLIFSTHLQHLRTRAVALHRPLPLMTTIQPIGCRKIWIVFVWGRV